MRRRYILKWAVYTLGVVLVAVLQGDPHILPRIAGMGPLLLIPCTAVVAMQEGEIPGAVFGVLGGLIWDVNSGTVFGYSALFLLVVAIVSALMVQLLFRNTPAAGLLFTIAFALLHGCVTWFFYVYLRGNVDFAGAFLRTILPTAAYTSLFAIPLYYLARLAGRKLTPAD